MIVADPKGDDEMSETTLESVASMATATNLTVQYGRAFKQKNGQQFVPFPSVFSSPPVVLVSSYWPNGNIVGSVETINSIDVNGFVVNSTNSADNIKGQPYYVDWIAVGPGAGA
jgi:hypothetical protein